MTAVPPARRDSLLLVGSLVPVVAALVASAMLLVDYVRPVPVFCSEGGGCDSLKHTAIAMPLGVPLPFFGIVGFAAIGVAALLNGQRARLAQVCFAGFAGLVGLSLLVLQVRMDTFCPYCCVADASGILSALVAGGRLVFSRGIDAGAPSPVLRYSGFGVMGVAVAAPFVLGFRTSPVPRVIRDEIARTPPGDVTVVDFVDFECPFCRMTHAELEPLLEEHRAQIRLVRRQVPLRMHPHAMDAARAACCGEVLGKGEAMANALFTTPVDDLTPEGCEKIAKDLGLPLDHFRSCVTDPATDQRIEADRGTFQAAGGFALPTIWINAQQLVGAQTREALESSLDAALARPSGS
jgi:uncharacterized membrane protein/predicted DsbA family dithiol-disulfide isomerase